MFNTKKIKITVTVLFLTILWLPILNKRLNLVKDGLLYGDIQNRPNPKFSYKIWSSGVYQKEKEDYLKDSISFKSFFIKLHNQWKYSFFNKTTAKLVVIGTEDYLYEDGYIKAALGIDYIGENAIKDKIQKIKSISKELKDKNIELVILLAPGKGAFYPDFFPKEYNKIKKSKTNHEVFSAFLEKENILYLDAKTWFNELKGTIHKKHRLYSKTGIHWSKFGEYLVADSLLRFLSNNTPFDFPRLILDTTYQSNILHDTDNDLWKGMNIFTKIPDFEMSYPIFHREKEDLNKTKVLTIADSYYWGLYNYGISKDYFHDGDFWFYFYDRYPRDKADMYDNTPLKDVVKDFNVVLLVCTDANIPHIGFGFLENWE